MQKRGPGRVFLWMVLLLACASGRSYAQDEPQFSQYMAAPVLFNPGAAGMDEEWISTLHIRSQWVSIPGAPQTQSITSQLPVYRLGGGLSMRMVNDRAGQQQTLQASVGYSWHLNFRKGVLGLGVYGGVASRTLDGSRLIAPQGSYENTIDHNDDLLPNTLENDIIPDAGAGLFLATDRLNAGVSVTHLLNNSFSFLTPVATSTIQYEPNAYVFVSYDLIRGGKWELIPTVLYKTDFTESMLDLNALVVFNQTLLAGVSYRGYPAQQANSFVALGGWNFSHNWSLRYSYDIDVSPLNVANEGSHEIVLMYRYPVQRPRAGKEINNLRYLYD